MSSYSFLIKSLSWVLRPFRPNPLMFHPAALIAALGLRLVLGELESSAA
jgi:hypothetical protein